MTPTDRDKELRAELAKLEVYTTVKSEKHPLYHKDIDKIMQLITADRKHVALESEMNAWKQVRKSYPKKQTLQGNAVSKLTHADVDRKITELKAQQEEV